MSAPERKFEYKRLEERAFSGFGGCESFDKLGADGWQLMHVYPSHDGVRPAYLFMREVTRKEPFRSVFEQVFGSRF